MDGKVNCFLSSFYSVDAAGIFKYDGRGKEQLNVCEVFVSFVCGRNKDY